MSHHAHGYRIYPDDASDVSHDAWRKADRWINGMEFRRDENEAVALAKLGVLSCGVPFVVMKMPIGGTRPKKCPCWIIG